jgi:trehalose/maltose hydrolase-like predicted phosphorylase
MGGRPVLNEDLVNLPNWLVLKLLIEGEEAIGFDNVELLSYRHELDVRNAVVIRELRFRDREVGRPVFLRRRGAGTPRPRLGGALGGMRCARSR